MAAEDLLEWIGGHVVQGAANGFAVTEIDTPNSPQAGLAMHIKQIIFEADFPDKVTTKTTTTSLALSKGSQPSSLGRLNDDHIIAVFAKEQYTSTTDNIFFGWDNGTEVLNLGEDAILFAGQKLYLAIDSTENTNVKNGRIKILYKLKKIPSKDFLDAITEDFT